MRKQRSFKISDELGFLELGRLDQGYIRDPDLRDILANTDLDSNKMKALESQKLRLITTVIYSERFEVKGTRSREICTYCMDIICVLLKLI